MSGSRYCKDFSTVAELGRRRAHLRYIWLPDELYRRIGFVVWVVRKVLRKSLHSFVEAKNALGPESPDEHAMCRRRVLRCRVNAAHGRES